MGKITRLVVSVFLASCAFGQLLPEQKQIDFQELAALYAKQYAPYEWKRDALGYDLLKIAPWLEKVRQSKSDLEFYEICSQYVASLNDAHLVYELPTDFFASIGFEVDLYDGKALIETIDLPTSLAFSIRLGDELVSVDGRTVAEWLKEFGKFSVFANARSTDRYNASLITFRDQLFYPRAAEIGDDASVVVRHAANGALETYKMPWEKSGLPITTVGPVPAPKLNSVRKPKSRLGAGDGGETPAEPPPAYLKPLNDLQNLRLPDQKYLRGFGEVTPVFSPSFPSSFVRRLGRSSDFFYSGTYQDSGKRIGFIRIPDMLAFDGAAAASTALRQFETEITFMQANTDGLVLDIMRNPGGIGCYSEELLRRVIPSRFRGIGVEVRATREWVLSISEAIDNAQFFGASQHTIDQLQSILVQLQDAYKQNRGRTDAIPACATYFERDPATTTAGSPLVYTKPTLLLTDEFTTSAAEVFAAIFQDSRRGPLFGWRTAGAGGSVSGAVPTGFYSESAATVTQSLLVRTQTVVTLDYPTTSYIENVGVRPDISVDYMTQANLTNRGKAFVDAFTAAIVNLLK